MLFYDTEIMKRLGLMIEYKRKEKAILDKKWQIGKFLCVNDVNMICDWKTYQKIKTGQLISNDLVYDELIEALGYSSAGVTETIHIVEQFGIDLMKPIADYDINKIEALCIKTQKKLLDFQNGILVDDYLLLIDMILGNYQNGNCISLQEYSKLEEMYPFMTLRMQSVFLDLMFHYISRNSRGSKVMSEFVERYDLKSRTEGFLQIIYCEFLINKSKDVKAKNVFIELVEHDRKENNIARELILSMRLFKALDGLFNKEYYFYYERIVFIMDKYKETLHRRILLSVNYELGMYFYSNRLYKEAFKYLYLCYIKDVNKFFYCYIFCNYINDINFIKNLSLNDNFIAPVNRKEGIYYNYFKLKKNLESKNNLESYILNKIKPTLEKADFYYEIFYHELLKLTDLTHHYKLLSIWNS